ncbi:MAG: hypothetical protein M9905_04240 [Rhizobiaceae bacterium]|nr:hypothetical protein [Rhizobiaceae bacterium]
MVRCISCRRDLAAYFPGVRLDIGILLVAVVAVATIVYSYRTTHGCHARLNRCPGDFAARSGCH